MSKHIPNVSIRMSSLLSSHGAWKEDVSSLVGSIVDHLKSTQAKCLDLRTLPLDLIKSAGADIQPILESLVGSAITELYLQNEGIIYKGEEFCKILTKTNIKKLNLHFYDCECDNLLKLMAILKNTQITDLDISGRHIWMTSKQLIDFCDQLPTSRLRALKLHGLTLPFEEVPALSRVLPDTRISCLDFARVCRHSFTPPKFELKNKLKIEPAKNRPNKEPIVWGILISNLQYTDLTELHLKDSHIADDSVKEIVNCLENSKLELLNLCNNEISDIGVDFLVVGLVNSKINSLNLSLNRIEGDNTLGRFLKDTNIRELDLSQNPLTDEKMFSAPNSLKGSTVVTLKLNNPTMSRGRVPLPIRELLFSELTSLELTNNNLRFVHVAALAHVLSNSKITHITLAGNEFSERCYNVLGDCLETSVVKYISLKETASSFESIRGIVSFLDKTKGSALVSVDLGGNYIRSHIKAIALSSANTTLLELKCYANGCGNNIAHFVPQLKFTAFLYLDLGDNGIGDKGVTALAKCLDETQIVKLNLSRNSITCQGARALASVLQKTKLRHIALHNNRIGDDGLECLAENAMNTCVTFLNVECNLGKRSLLVDRVVWENRKKIQRLADLLKRSPIFTGDSKLFEFDRNFRCIDIEVFIDDCSTLYKVASNQGYIVNAIEQDKCFLELKKLNRRNPNSLYNDKNFNVCIEDCELIYNKIMEHPSPVKDAKKQKNNVFKEQILWLILEYFPRKFSAFIGTNLVADVEQHVDLLKRIEESGSSGLVEALLWNRPVYMIDKEKKILHPYTYKLMSKYKDIICNTDIEPDGLENVRKYFEAHIDMDGATDVLAFLSDT